MSTVIRVKRLRDEEPMDTLVLNCKRRKIASDVADSNVSTVIRFAVTLDNQEEDVMKYVKKSTKEELESDYKKHTVNIHDKLKSECQSALKNNRYRVVNLRRFDGKEGDNEYPEDVTVVDVEATNKEHDKTDVESLSSDQMKYVFDLYYVDPEGYADFDPKDLGMSEDVEVFVFGSSSDNGIRCEDINNDSSEDDSSDSNGEAAWGNDYPEEMDSSSDEEMIQAMGRVGIDKGYELSSDDEEEEGFRYSIDSEATGFEEDIDPTDVRRYGEMFARFKARFRNSEQLGCSTDGWANENFDHFDE